MKDLLDHSFHDYVRTHEQFRGQVKDFAEDLARKAGLDGESVPFVMGERSAAAAGGPFGDLNEDDRKYLETCLLIRRNHLGFITPVEDFIRNIVGDYECGRANFARVREHIAGFEEDAEPVERIFRLLAEQKASFHAPEVA